MNAIMYVWLGLVVIVLLGWLYTLVGNRSGKAERENWPNWYVQDGPIEGNDWNDRISTPPTYYEDDVIAVDKEVEEALADLADPNYRNDT